MMNQHPLDPVRPGDIRMTWCSRHWDRTDHLWTGYQLICLLCHPERDPRREIECNQTTSLTAKS